MFTLVWGHLTKNTVRKRAKSLFSRVYIHEKTFRVSPPNGTQIRLRRNKKSGKVIRWVFFFLHSFKIGWWSLIISRKIFKNSFYEVNSNPMQNIKTLCEPIWQALRSSSRRLCTIARAMHMIIDLDHFPDGARKNRSIEKMEVESPLVFFYHLPLLFTFLPFVFTNLWIFPMNKGHFGMFFLFLQRFHWAFHLRPFDGSIFKNS